MSSSPWEYTLRITDQEASFLTGLLLAFCQPGRWEPQDREEVAPIAAGLLEKLAPIAEAWVAAAKERS